MDPMVFFFDRVLVENSKMGVMRKVAAHKFMLRVKLYFFVCITKRKESELVGQLFWCPAL